MSQFLISRVANTFGSIGDKYVNLDHEDVSSYISVWSFMGIHLQFLEEAI